MTGYKAYQGNQVEGSGPLGLVLLTYEALYKSLAQAKRAIEHGDLAAEGEYVGRALEALVELSSSLNMEEGGEVAKNLASLYIYMTERLSNNMCSDSSQHIEEVMHLVETLREGWQQLARDQKKLMMAEREAAAANDSTVSESYGESGSHSATGSVSYAA